MIGKEKEELDKRINLINNDKIREFTNQCLNIAPKYFWVIPASSSGRYHPPLSLGEGGLLRHTIAAVDYGSSLCEKNTMNTIDRDKIISSLILHDTCKAGVKDIKNNSFYPWHAFLPKKHYKEIAKSHLPLLSKEIFDMIDSHMGQWTTKQDKIPETRNQKITHYADYLASRKKQPILDYSKEIIHLQTYDFSIEL